MDQVVELCDVGFSYKRFPVLEDIQLHIYQGDFLGIIGPNGGGKTTLLKIILGLLQPDRGQVRVFGTQPGRVSQKMGYVPQHTRFDPVFPITVMGVVLMGLLSPRHLGVWYSRQEKKAAFQAMESTGVSHLSQARFGDLSGGQKQRVLLARALVSNPQLLILDEPMASIDYHCEEQLYSLLQGLNRRVTILLVSHDLGVISTCVNRVACVNRRLVLHSPRDLSKDVVEEFFHRPVPILHHRCMF